MAKNMTNEEIMKKVKDLMLPHGLECGNEISEIVKELHPDCVVIPLYRSAVAIEAKIVEDAPRVFIHSYGDPHADGEDITKENIRIMRQTYLITGDRYGAKLFEVREIGENEQEYSEMRSEFLWKEIALFNLYENTYFKWIKVKGDETGGMVQVKRIKKRKKVPLYTTWIKKHENDLDSL